MSEPGSDWRVVAAPDCLTAADPRRRLRDLPNLTTDTRLHLQVPTRQVACESAASWVDAVLDGKSARARDIAVAANGLLPFRLTRDQPTMRARVRAVALGSRRGGLVCSSGGRRLRAVGLGAELPHMDENAVARWFLDRWPDDVRAAGALEVVATEFSIQGLELDAVGLCWDLDLAWRCHGWEANVFRGTRWNTLRQPEKISNQINTYRVLLTRARRETVIYVPPGNAADRTRPPHGYDDIANFLTACGVPTL